MNAPVLVTAPSAEPVTLAEAKAHLRVDDTNSDSKITSLIKAARLTAENFMQRALCLRTYRLTLDRFPQYLCPLDLPMSPVLSIDSVKYYDTSGTLVTWSSAEYILEADSEPARLVHDPSFTWPTDYQQNRIGLVQVQYQAGYAASTDSPTDYAANVPDDIKAAIMLILGDLYENRESTLTGTRAAAVPLPYGAESLLYPYRILRG